MSRKFRRQQANKQNAQHSTGPKTEQGKAISSQNSFRHGLSASAIIALPGEDIQDYIELGNGLRAEHKPVTITEDALVTKMAQGLWLGKRAQNLQQRLFLDVAAPDPKLLALYMRYQTMHDHAFSTSLKELQTLRKAPTQQQTGFVSQKQKDDSHEAKINHLNARTAAIEFNTNLRKTRTASVLVPQHRDVAS